MFEAGILGSLIGGIFRIIPEVIKLFDAKDSRKHELALLQAEMEFAKVKGEIMMRQTEAVMTVAELDAMSEAIKEQGMTARAAGRFVSAISALVRPLVTYWFVFCYSIVKYVTISLALEQNGNWKEVIKASWTSEDMAILMMILTFWFVGRIWDKYVKR
jgi:hypothetical protein